MNAGLGSVGDDWLAVVTIFAPALVPLMFAVGLWFIMRESRGEPAAESGLEPERGENRHDQEEQQAPEDHEVGIDRIVSHG